MVDEIQTSFRLDADLARLVVILDTVHSIFATTLMIFIADDTRTLYS